MDVEELKTEVRLYARDLALHHAWEAAFEDCPRVSSHNTSIFEARASALVSPANSFGYMDGGLDLQISERFGWHLEDNAA